MRVAIDGRKIFDFGIGTYLRSLLRGLAAIDSDDEYVVLAPPAAEEVIPPDARFTRGEVEAAHYSISELFRLRHAIDASRCDLFHAPHYVTPFTAVPMVVTVHDMIHLDFPAPNPLKLAYARWMIRRSVGRARKVLVVSRTVGELISRRYPSAKKKIVVTPNGIDPAGFRHRDEERISALRERFRLGDAPVVLFVGNDKRHKNLAVLVAAFEEISREGGDARLFLAGRDFSDVADAKRTIGGGFLSHEDLLAAYQTASVLVMPSLYEGFGLPALEAMASGCPVIASDGGALPEVVGDAALIFEARSPASLASALRRVLASEELRRDLRQKGFRRAALYPWQATARLTHEAYRDALTTR